MRVLRPKTFADCVAWARLKFEELFSHTIKQLLQGFPPDMITTSGGTSALSVCLFVCLFKRQCI